MAYSELMALITKEQSENDRYSVSIGGKRVAWPCRKDQYETLILQASGLARRLIENMQGKKPEEIKATFKNEVYNYAWNMFPP